MRSHLLHKQFYLFSMAALFLGIMLTIQSSFAVDNKSDATESKRQEKVTANKLGTKFTVHGITIGSAKKEVLAALGKPGRIDLSEYGFEWYIYNQDYTQYVQVGLAQDKVVALYTNSPNWSSTSKIGFGVTKQEVEKTFGQPLTKIKKGKMIFNFEDSRGEYAIYLLGDVYTTIFYDLLQDNTVTAIQLVDQKTELAFKQFYGEPSEQMRVSFERQVFDLANAVRVRAEKVPFDWNEEIATTARKHSVDMVKRNYFSHESLDGKTPFDRLKSAGIIYKRAGENIAAGQTNAIFAHESWMNSLGHRQNILGDYDHLGVGVSFGGMFEIYYTQNFISPLSETPEQGN